jgi:hypothetical protein
VRQQQSSRLCAPVALALFLPTATETTSSNWRGRQRESRWHSGQPRTPKDVVAEAQTGADAPAVLWAGRARRPCPQRRRQPRQARMRRRLSRRRLLPSQAARLSLPRQVPWSPWDPCHCQGRRSRRPDGGWPTLTKTNYVELAAVTRV